MNELEKYASKMLGEQAHRERLMLLALTKIADMGPPLHRVGSEQRLHRAAELARQALKECGYVD
jgi:hypothetical protein